jgi:microcystin degradation protein MlrC
MRIAIAEIGQETCHFTPVRTTIDTFRQNGLYEGEDVLSKRSVGAGYIAGFLKAAEEEKVDLELVPIISGWAGANGPLVAETVNFLIDKVERGLKAAGPVDGFFFGLHGAAAAEEEPDVEGVLLQRARRILGPDVPIVVPFDHHGSMTRLKMANLNGLVGHRTQPHMPFDTGYWAAKQLFAIVRGDVRPTIAWHRVPMIAHQEQFLTARGPMKEWFDCAREMEKMEKVVAVSPFPMQPWLDVPEGGWVTVVVTNNDQALANKLSAELAQMVWDKRAEFWVFESIAVEEAVKRAVDAPRGLIILSDTGDSVYGGATGDSTVILRELVRQQVPELALVTIVDAESALDCWQAGAGSTLDLTLGGKLDPLFGKPLPVRAKVLALGEGRIETTMGIRSEYDMGKRALLEIGNVRVVVSENVGVGGNHPSVYQSFGIDPAEAKIAVLKTASNFQHYADITAEVIRVDTVGPTMSHLDQFQWQHLPRPIYSFDDLPHWQATAENANVVEALLR